MDIHQGNKNLVLCFQQEIERCGEKGPCSTGLEKALEKYTAPGYLWHGTYPFEERQGSAAADIFWRPLLNSWSHLQRRQDVLMAGASVTQGGNWVMSMGNFIGMFRKPWLGIPPTGRLAFLRYCEFHRIEEGRVAETYCFTDVIGVMKQAGVDPLPGQTGAEIMVPGPRTNDGIINISQDPEESKKTLELIERMAEDLGAHPQVNMDPVKLGETWHENMLWYGPSGIGTTMSIDGFKRQHQMPFRKSLYSHRARKLHKARFTEGVYGTWVGWPSLSLKMTSGGFLGLPATDKDLEMRVVDVYRRENDKIAENWVFIDLPHILKQQDLDIFERMEQLLQK